MVLPNILPVETNNLFVFFQVHNLQELRRSASLATKVFVQRDYSDGTMCQFQTKFPPELDSRVQSVISWACVTCTLTGKESDLISEQ